MPKKVILLVLVVLLAGLSMEIYAQGRNSNWRTPPFPQWFMNLSEVERRALMEIGINSWITNTIVSPGNVRIETRRIIDAHVFAWAYRKDDPQNIFSIIFRSPYTGEFRQVMISRHWLNNLR